MEFKIYKLYYKSEPNKIYVGVSKNVKGRIKSHLSEAKRLFDTNKGIWINSHEGEELLFEILEETDNENRFVKEQFWIKDLTNKGFILTNSMHVLNSGRSQLTRSKLLEKNKNYEEQITSTIKEISLLKTTISELDLNTLFQSLKHLSDKCEELTEQNKTLNQVCNTYFNIIVANANVKFFKQ